MPDGAAWSRQLPKFYLVLSVRNVVPGVGAGVLGDALEWQRKHTERDYPRTYREFVK